MKPIKKPRVFVSAAAWTGLMAPQTTDAYGFRSVLDYNKPELGGGLFGYWDGDDMVVTDATGRVRPETASSSSMMIDLRYIDDMAVRFRGSQSGLIGTWHSHPSIDDVGYSKPSPPDLRHLASMQRASGSSRPFLGICLSPASGGEFGCLTPKLTCVLSRGDDNVDWQRAWYVPVAVEDNPGRCANIPCLQR